MFLSSFVYLFGIRSIKTHTIDSAAWKHSCSTHVEQLPSTTSEGGVCCCTIVAPTATLTRAPLDSVRVWLQIIRCLFSLDTSFSPQQLTDWRAARSRRSRGSTQKSHVETRLVRNRPNSVSDCSVYAALQPWAGGCPRCMFRLRRVCVVLLCLGWSRQSQPPSVIQTVCEMGNDCWWDSAAGYEGKRLRFILDCWLTWFISWVIGVIVPITLIHLQ